MRDQLPVGSAPLSHRLVIQIILLNFVACDARARWFETALLTWWAPFVDLLELHAASRPPPWTGPVSVRNSGGLLNSGPKEPARRPGIPMPSAAMPRGQPGTGPDRLAPSRRRRSPSSHLAAPPRLQDWLCRLAVLLRLKRARRWRSLLRSQTTVPPRVEPAAGCASPPAHLRRSGAATTASAGGGDGQRSPARRSSGGAAGSPRSRTRVRPGGSWAKLFGCRSGSEMSKLSERSKEKGDY
ncbi:Hypothetical predicted protein [Olea europaea subsp. europaea]|uniref:Uncharacterized protein n=1 Tax=Olea europaea subsp. europaea TaxID=158383 RepID=A0A8S0UGI9_OLEEU|nr:Hypothetical predicted protein [Olea europaea subsp. europaea]